MDDDGGGNFRLLRTRQEQEDADLRVECALTRQLGTDHFQPCICGGHFEHEHNDIHLYPAERVELEEKLATLQAEYDQHAPVTLRASSEADKLVRFGWARIDHREPNGDAILHKARILNDLNEHGEAYLLTLTCAMDKIKQALKLGRTL